MVRSTFSLLFITFIKTCSWKSLMKNQVKGHIYLDKLVTGSIYVIEYRFPRKSPKSGFLEMAAPEGATGLNKNF